MKKSIILFTFFAIALSVLVSCQKKQPTNVVSTVESEPEVAEIYQPVHRTENVRLEEMKRYTYYASPTSEPAVSVVIQYNEQPYVAPTIVTYSYKNGDTYTYILPKEFALRENEIGRLRIVQDQYHTVWMQGQTKKGKFHEVIFYGNPEFNNKKIKPNSYINHPKGVIKYQN